MATQVNIRYDTAANWTATNPRLKQGEFGMETDTRRKKIGDGVLFWNSLPYEFDASAGWLLGGNTQTAEVAFGNKTAQDIPFIINNTEIARWSKVGSEPLLRIGIPNTMGGNIFLETVGQVTPWFDAQDARLLLNNFYGLSLSGGVVTLQVSNNYYAAIYAAGSDNGNVSLISRTGIAINHAHATLDNTDAVSGVAANLGKHNLAMRSGDIPTTSYVDGFLLYSADRSGAGTASPFIRTENGTIIDLAGLGTGSGTVTTVSVVTANGVSGTVANPNTIPAITLTLGAITPSSVVTSGIVTGSALKATGTGGAGYVEYLTQSSPPAAGASGFREFADASGRKSWIRQSDGFIRTWDATLTGNRVWTMPDATTTMVGIDTVQTLTNKSIVATQLTGTLAAAQFPALTGDVTTSAGALATAIGNNKVTLGMMAQVVTRSVLGRNTAGTGNVEVLTNFFIGMLFHSTGGGNTIAASTTTYGEFGFGNSVSTTETSRQITISAPCTIAKLFVRTLTGQPAGGALVVTIRKNAGATTLTTTIAGGAGAGTFSDVNFAHGFTVVEGDRLAIEFANANTGISASILEVTVGMFF